jgi:hypothetical protein
MHELTQISNAVSAMSPGMLIAIVLLGGFGLAAFAIYDVMTIVGEAAFGLDRGGQWHASSVRNVLERS